MTLARKVCLAAGSIALSWLLGAPPAVCQTPRVAVFGGSTGMTFLASSPMALGSHGTIEVSFLVGWEGALDDPPCLLSTADENGLDAALFLTPDASGLVLIGRGGKEASLEYDFADDAFHHLALVLREHRTEVIVDGASLGTVDIDFGGLRGRMLMLGHASSEAQFIGAMAGLRLWRRALAPEDFARLLLVEGAPPADWPEARDLAGFAVFSDAGEEMVLIDPPGSKDDPAVDAKTVITPLAFDGAASLSYPISDPLPSDRVGTIDLWLSAKWTGTLAYRPCIVAQGQDAALRLAVVVEADRSAIGLSDGRREALVPADLSDGELHHIALVTVEDTTLVYLDAELAGVAQIGYGSGSASVLQVGTCDGVNRGFVETLADLRFWKSALFPDEVADVLEYSGAPPAGDSLESRLVALADFTASESGLLVASELATGGRGQDTPRRLKTTDTPTGPVDTKKKKKGY